MKSLSERCLPYVLAVLLTTGSASAQVRSTQSGMVQGMTIGSEAQFLGIPFAAPPVGPLRWRPPAAPADWQGTRSATAYGAPCPQQGVATASEDCLTLNIFAPATALPGAKLPVLIWIYGGGFVSGASALYDPTTLVTRGNVIAVTFNYRIGYLGFLAHPALTANDPNHVSGNYGVLDQKAALTWVRNNVANFGGDPDQMTVFGESAGGQSVYAQLIMTNPVPLKGAIAQSGAFLTNYPTLKAAEAAGQQAATALGCADQTLSCLQGLAASTLANALNPLTGTTLISPVIDGANLPSGPAVAFASGRFERVPIINGSNHDEMRLFAGISRYFGAPPLIASDYVAKVQATYGENAAGVLQQYPVSNFATPDYAWAAVRTDSGFACNAHLLNAQLSRQTPVFAYELNDPNGPEPVGPVVAGFTYASAHGSDLSDLFPTLFAPVLLTAPPQLTPAQSTLAGTLRDLWLNFARHGYPFASSQPLPWPVFTDASPFVLSLVPPTTAVETGFVPDHHCSFWAPGLLQAAGLPPGSPY
jgi:para-nitrobenzyl esterase